MKFLPSTTTCSTQIRGGLKLQFRSRGYQLRRHPGASRHRSILRWTWRVTTASPDGYTGQTTEVFAYPSDITFPTPFQRIVGVPLKSFVTVSWTYHFRQTNP